MLKKIYKFKGKVWLWGYSDISPWHFVSVPKKETTQILKDFGKFANGFRSIPISVTIGKTTWNTSMFLDSRTSTYLLPLKAKARKEEEIFNEDIVSFSFRILL